MAKKKVKDQIDTQEVIETVEDISTQWTTVTVDSDAVSNPDVEEDTTPTKEEKEEEQSVLPEPSEEEQSLETIPAPEVPEEETHEEENQPEETDYPKSNIPVQVGEAYIHKCLPGVPDHYSKYSVRIKTDNGYRNLAKAAKVKAKEIAIKYNKEKGINSTKIFED